MNNNYKDLVKEEVVKEKQSNYYKIDIICDANDGDYMRDSINISDIFNDELFFLVLCYLCTGTAFGYDPWSNVFGHHIGGYSDGDKFFDWLGEYCFDYHLLLYAGMCDCECHSIKSLEITHYVQGNKYRVLLPSIDEIFDTEQEMVDYMNNLYDKQYNNG